MELHSHSGLRRNRLVILVLVGTGFLLGCGHGKVGDVETGAQGLKVYHREGSTVLLHTVGIADATGIVTEYAVDLAPGDSTVILLPTGHYILRYVRYLPPSSTWVMKDNEEDHFEVFSGLLTSFYWSHT